MKKFSHIILAFVASITLATGVHAETLTPKQISALINQADNEKKNGQLEQSVKDYKEIREQILQIIKEHPNASKPYYALAQVNTRLGRQQEASEAMTKAKQLRQEELKNSTPEQQKNNKEMQNLFK
jgi:tetratricopeptide (TPR) repeat protein